MSSTDVILTGMEKQELSALVLQDMNKAFDSINNDLLPLKLQDFGISKYALLWFRNNLINRY